MRTIAEVDTALRGKLEKDRVHTKTGKGSSGPLKYIKAGGVALAMNEAFTPLGWDVEINSVEILEKAHKINLMGLEDAEKGTYWNAITQATVTVKARALYSKDVGNFEEVVRSDVGVGSAVGGKAKTKVDAYQNSITSAVTNAFKRACRFFGPKTGLTLQFEPGERESIQMLIDAMGAVSGTEESIEGTDDAESEQATDHETAAEAPVEAAVEQEQPVEEAPAEEQPQEAQVETTEAPAEAPVETAAQSEAPQELFGPIEIPAVMKSFAGEEITRICALESGSSPVAPADVGAFHTSMAKAFGGAKAALGIWQAAGVTPGKGVVVTRDNVMAVAQVLDEASAGEGGIAAFVAQFNQPPAPAADKPGTATVVIDGNHVAGPAPTAAPSTNGNGTTHGEDMQAAWDASPLGIEERRKRYLSRLGEGKREIVELLATVPDDQELTKVDAGKVHAVAVARLQRLNQPVTEVTNFWKQAGFALNGGGQPRGRHIRAFVDLLPD